MTKRIFSFVLAALMAFAIVPFMAFSATGEEIEEDNYDALIALAELYSLDIYEELKSQTNAEYNAFIDIAKNNGLDLFDFIVLPRKIRVALAIDLKDKTDLTQQELDYAVWAGPSVLPDETYNSYYVQDGLVVFFDSALYIEGMNKDIIGTEFAHSNLVINTDADGRRYANGKLTFNSLFPKDKAGNLISGYTMESIMKVNEAFSIDLGLEEFNVKVSNGKSVVYDHRYYSWNFFNQPPHRMPYSNMLNATNWGNYAVNGVEKGNVFVLTAIADVNSGTLNYDKEKGAYPFPENTLGTIYDYMCNTLKKPTESEIASGAKTFEGAYIAQVTEEYAAQGHTVTNDSYLGSYAGTKGEYKTVYKSLTGQDIDVETFNFPEPEIVADKYSFDGTFVLKLLANGDSIIPDKYDTSVIIDERAFAYKNKSSYNFSIGNGTNADIYLTRVYSKALSEAEVEQNHFVDLMKYNKVGIYAYEKLSDEKKAIVHSAFANIKLEDKSKEELRALFLAEVENLVCDDHIFDREVVSNKFLKSPATTTDEATYYKSCVCGEKCEETFTIPGLLNSDGVGTEGSFTYKVVDGCAIITNCNTNASGTIVVPNTLGGYPVTEISTSAFALCKNLEVVKFGDSSHVTRIGELAFFECSSLEYIEIPADVKKIGSYAFAGCSSLVGIDVDDENAYYYSEGNCIIKRSTKELIVGCKNSEIPDGVISIAELAFARSGIQNVYIPASVTYIGAGAFSDCNSIESITVDAANPVYYSDGNCLINKETKELILGCNDSVIPEGVKSIGFAAFYGCGGLTSVEIPASVVSISDYAFYNCGLTEVSFAENSALTSIGDSAFFGCADLASIAIPANVKVIGDNAFSGCVGLTEISFDEHSQLASIGNSAFYGCENLESIEIPYNVTDIGSYAFSGCIGLESITVAAGNTVYQSKGNCLINKEKKELTLGLDNSIIPVGVESISNGAFEGRRNLQSVVIPASVVSIGDFAFSECVSLTSVIFAGDSALTSIGDYAFAGCYNLKSIIMPDGIESIGSYAFSKNLDLESVTIPEGIETIGELAFLNNIRLADIYYAGADEQWNAVEKGANWDKSATYNMHSNASHTHVFDKEVADENYLVSGTGCTSQPIYYNSCECGESSEGNTNSTFTYGAALGHTGGEATCDAQAICERCGASYGELGTHVYNKEVAAEQHLKKAATCEEKAIYYKSCACGETYEGEVDATFEHGDALGHTGGNATCEEKAVCERCGTSYGTFGEHVYDNEVAEEIYLKDEATCEEKAVYYMSCDCGDSSEGKVEEDTFEYGEALGHTGGSASCTEQAVCTRCGEPYGDLLAHEYDKEVVSDDYLKSETSCTEKAVYYKSCECGDSSEGKVEEDTFEHGEALGHTGGSASCTEQAVCTRCGEPYGDLIAHEYDKEVASDDYLKSEATCTEKAVYYKSCECGDSSEGKVEEDTFEYGEALGHTGGSASCTEKAICERCEEPYGDLLSHEYDKEVVSDVYLKSEATCTEKTVYYKSCVCGESSEGKTGEATFEHGEALGHTGGSATHTEQAICDRCGEPYGDLLESTIDSEYAKQLLSFIGYQSRISAYPGIRSLYGISKEHLEAIEAQGFEVIVGAIMAGASGRTTADLVVPIENGIYKSDAFRNHSYKENGISILEVYDGTQTEDKIVGKILENDSDSIDFAYTTVFKTEATQTAIYYQAGLLYRGYVIIKGANSDGTDLILYTDNESVFNGGSNGEEISLEEISRYMKDVYDSDDEMTQMVLNEIEFKHICDLMYSIDSASSWAGVGSYYTLEKDVTFSASIVSRLEQASKDAYESTVNMTSKNATLDDLLTVFEEYKEKVKNIIDSADKYDIVISTDEKGYEKIKVRNAWSPIIK